MTLQKSDGARMDTDHGFLPVELLGQGPVTEVWKAINMATGRNVALKIPRHSVEGIPGARSLLAHEALVCQTVRHRALPVLHQFETSGADPFLAMRLLDGGNLDSRIRGGVPWTLLEVIDTVSNIAEGLEALHRAGWVHGDVQPGNVFLESTGNTRLIDLGGAHLPGRHPYLDTAMEPELVGSADYWAPEICKTNGVGGPAADLFSLGIVAFELLAGHRPWPSGSLRETIKRHHGDPAARLESPWCHIPTRLRRLVEDLLAREPEKRPSAGQVADALGKLAVSMMGRGMAA